MGSKTARICSKFVTVATDTDAALVDADLPLNSNYKCGKPGNYLFDASNANVGMYAESVRGGGGQILEPRQEKTTVLHLRKQRRRSASR